MLRNFFLNEENKEENICLIKIRNSFQEFQVLSKHPIVVVKICYIAGDKHSDQNIHFFKPVIFTILCFCISES